MLTTESQLTTRNRTVEAANGVTYRMVPTKNTHLLGERLPDARVQIYPDAGHGFLFQYPAEFAATVDQFLSE
jgi:pimeloyl-ACP methyl ester carboxylesterase